MNHPGVDIKQFNQRFNHLLGEMEAAYHDISLQRGRPTVSLKYCIPSATRGTTAR